MNKQIRVGISSCLIGKQVRFDGKDKLHPLILERIAPYVELVPYCPEVEADLGVPRIPIHLHIGPNGIHALSSENQGFEMTNKLVKVAHQFMQEQPGLSGYIFKCRSPSCGLNSVPLYDTKGKTRSFGSGIFATELMHAWPYLVVVEETDLYSEACCDAFLQCLEQQTCHSILPI